MNPLAVLNSGLSMIRRTDACGVCAAVSEAMSRSAQATLSAILMHGILLPRGGRLLRKCFERTRRVAEKARLARHRLGRRLQARGLEVRIHLSEIEHHPRRQVLKLLCFPGVQVVPAVLDLATQRASPDVGRPGSGD